MATKTKKKPAGKASADRSRKSASKTVARKAMAGTASHKSTRTAAKPKARATDRAATGITAKNLTSAETRFLNKHKDKLSPTTLRAKWIHSPDEHEDRPGQTLATRQHEVIRAWAEERGATPATVGSPAEGERPRVLRFDFTGGNSRLHEISWDDWFDTFDNRHLIFLFQEHMRKGNDSNFFRFDSPKREHA